MKEFTEEELALYNGKNGRQAYVAYRGKVYDVSASFLWKDGNHQVLHEAGVDLTRAMEQAPHGEEVLESFPVIGILRNKGMLSTPSRPL
ncbi:MAG: cytochrome b5 domain-containing protein [Candidatus Bathyarchaeia archaeon]